MHTLRRTAYIKSCIHFGVAIEGIKNMIEIYKKLVRKENHPNNRVVTFEQRKRRRKCKFKGQY
jgi:hypothetical protein